MGCPFKRAWRGGGTIDGRRHAATRSREGRGGQRGSRATRCGRQRCTRAVLVQVVRDRCRNRGGGGLPGGALAQ
jgi:hypothetical protein